MSDVFEKYDAWAEKTKKCPKCGKEVNVGAKACIYCGLTFSEEEKWNHHETSTNNSGVCLKCNNVLVNGMCYECNHNNSIPPKYKKSDVLFMVAAASLAFMPLLTVPLGIASAVTSRKKPKSLGFIGGIVVTFIGFAFIFYIINLILSI